MKTIKVHITDDVYKDIREHLMIRGMCGELGGLLDAALFRICKAIEEGEEEVTLQRPKKKS